MNGTPIFSSTDKVSKRRGAGLIVDSDDEDEDEDTDGCGSGAEHVSSGDESVGEEDENEIVCANSNFSPSEDDGEDDPLVRFKSRSNGSQPVNRRLQLDFHVPSSDAAHEADIYRRRKDKQRRVSHRISASPSRRRYNLRSRGVRDVIRDEAGQGVLRSPVYRLRKRDRHLIPVKSATGMITWNSLDLSQQEDSEDSTSSSDDDRTRKKNEQSQKAFAETEVRGDIGFDQIAGVDGFLMQLKEMIILPLVYPDLFKNLGIVPPRGVIFHGPPGTGKTLLARILASASSKLAGRPVAFFHRNGSECLSKWIGEAEQNLAKLFKQAKQQAPSIIFFDEIDGMAPDRSGANGGRAPDQSHISLVSMLLSLMDGLDDRGAVVVIGATNRIDSVDPALRRPGRFDKEFFFPLPDMAARRSILTLGCSTGNKDPVPDWLLDRLAKETEGMSGAELKGLCTEASLVALRRTCPSLYASDMDNIVAPQVQHMAITEQDFYQAYRTSRASAPSLAKSSVVGNSLPKPLLRLMGPVIRQLVRDVERLTVTPTSDTSHAWQSGLHHTSPRLPIASLHFDPPEESASPLSKLDFLKMQRRLLFSLALRLAPTPSSVTVLDPASVLLGPQSPDSILLGRYRATSFHNHILVVNDLSRLFSLVSDDAFDLWLQEWSMSDSSRLLLLHPAEQAELIETVVFQRLDLSFSLVPNSERHRFIDYCLGHEQPAKDLSDLLGVVGSSSPIPSDLDEPVEEESWSSEQKPAVPTPSWLCTFPRACSLYHQRTDDQLTW